jgi:hypothetical protein
MNHRHTDVQKPTREELMRQHRPVGGWSIQRRYIVVPVPVWTPRVCAADGELWPDDCPVIRSLRADDPELEYALYSGYLPDVFRT